MTVTRLAAPTGVWRDASELAAPKDKARALENFLVDQPGKLRCRGPLGAPEELFSSDTAWTGIWVHGENFLVSKHTTSKLYDTDAGTVTDVTLAAAEHQLDGRAARVGSRAFGPSTDTATTLLYWDGTSTAPAPVPEAPKGAADVCTHLERLFVGGGSQPTASTIKPNVLWYSDAGGPMGVETPCTGAAATDTINAVGHDLSNGDRIWFSLLVGGQAGLTLNTRYYVINAATDTFQVSTSSGGSAVTWTVDLSFGTYVKALGAWQDDVSGLTNQILVGEAGDPIVGLVSLGRMLVIFKQYSIWALLGDTPSTFTVRRLADTMGLRNKEAAVAVDDVILFVNGDGRPMIFDGTQVARLDGISNRFNTVNDTYVSRIANDHVAFVNGTTRFAMLYLPTRGWTDVSFDSDVMPSTAQTTGTATTELGLTYIVNGQVARLLEDLSNGDLTSTFLQEETEDGLSTRIILPSVTYRTQDLASPFHGSAVWRVAVAHALTQDGASINVKWTVSISATGDTATEDYEIDALDVADGVRSQRSVIDVGNKEMNDIQITIALSGTTATADADIYDVWVEHEPAQRR